MALDSNKEQLETNKGKNLNIKGSNGDGLFEVEKGEDITIVNIKRLYLVAFVFMKKMM